MENFDSEYIRWSDLSEMPKIDEIASEFYDNENEKLYSVEAAYIYDRKGVNVGDPVLGERNKAYGSEDDDIVIQVKAGSIDNYSADFRRRSLSYRYIIVNSSDPLWKSIVEYRNKANEEAVNEAINKLEMSIQEKMKELKEIQEKLKEF